MMGRRALALKQSRNSLNTLHSLPRVTREHLVARS